MNFTNEQLERQRIANERHDLERERESIAQERDSMPTARCFHVAKGLPCTRYLEGVEAERYAIVLWLRGKTSSASDDRVDWEGACAAMADEIEAKAHHKPNSGAARRVCGAVTPGELLVECECGALRPYQRPHGFTR